MTRASTIIQQADKGNAQRYAAADLQKAHDELRDAEKANDARRYDEARRYAEARKRVGAQGWRDGDDSQPRHAAA
jgi:hypothetical protein